MTVLSQIDLMQLVDGAESPCVSLYMPTHASGREQQQDEIRHKNLLKQAQSQLAQRDIDDDAQARELETRVLENLALIPQDDKLWRHRSDGLAAFSAPGFFRAYTLPLRFSELVIVSGEFYVSPLLPLLHANGRFFILALTKTTADLYEATRYTLQEHDLPELSPIEVDGAEQTLQYHSQKSPSQGKGGGDQIMYHGHGGPDDREQGDIENFFKRQVDPEVHKLLKGQTAPLILACVDSLASIYREANTYDYLLEGHVSGSPSQASDQTLREQAWRLVEPVVHEVELAATQQFGDFSGTDRALAEIDPIKQAAREGRVETLFVPTPHAPLDDNELLHPIEESAKQTLLAGGQVLAVETVPGGNSLAAILRY